MKKIIVVMALLMSVVAFAADQDITSANKRIQYLENQKTLIQIKADAQKEYIDSEIKQLRDLIEQLKAINKTIEKEKEKKKK